MGVEDVLRADGVAARVGLAVGIASRAALARVCAAAPTVHGAQAEGALTSATGRKARAGIATSREARGVVDECAGIATSRKARDGRGPEQRPAGCGWALGVAWASLPAITVHASSREARIDGAGGVDARIGRPVGVEDVLRADGVAARVGLAVGIASRAALARVCAAAPTVHGAQAEGALTSATGRKARAGIATSREARGVEDELVPDAGKARWVWVLFSILHLAWLVSLGLLVRESVLNLVYAKLCEA